MSKPRVGFCWICGKRLRGNHHAEVVIQGHPRIVHKGCAKDHEDEIEREKRACPAWCGEEGRP